MTDQAAELGPDGRHEALLRYVERFADVLRDSGMAPMPARLFAYVLAVDADRYTAAELAAGLRVSPAAISGAVRYLVGVGMLTRERVPGSSGSVYRLATEDVWFHVYGAQLARVAKFQEVAEQGVEVVGAGSRGGRRLRETAEFFAFIGREYAGLMSRWHAYYRERFEAGEPSREPTGDAG